MTLFNIAIFYACGAAVFGVVAASSEKVHVSFRNRSLPFPRLFVGIIIGAFWPVALAALLLQGSGKGTS